MRRSSSSSSGLGTGDGGGDFVSWALWLARRRSLSIRLFVVPFFFPSCEITLQRKVIQKERMK